MPYSSTFSLLMHWLTFLLSANFESLFRWKFFIYLIIQFLSISIVASFFTLFSHPPFFNRHIVGQTPLYGQPLNTDPSLLRTVDRFAAEERESASYINFPKFIPLNTETSLIWTHSITASVS